MAYDRAAIQWTATLLVPALLCIATAGPAHGVINPAGFPGSDLFAQITSALSTACGPSGCSIDAREFRGRSLTIRSGPLIINKPVHLVLSGNIVNTRDYSVDIKTAAETGTTVTIHTAAAHPFSNGWIVQITGVQPAGYDGVFRISNVTPTTFAYTADARGLTGGAGGTAAAGMLQIGPGGTGSRITCDGGRDSGDIAFEGLPVTGNACALVDTPKTGHAPIVTIAGGSLSAITPGTKAITIDNVNFVGNSHITDGIAAGAGNQLTIIERDAFTAPYGSVRGSGPTGTAVHFSGRIADNSIIRDNVINGWANGVWADASSVGTPGGTFGPIIENNFLVQQTGSFFIRCSGCFDAWIAHNNTGSSNLAADASGILLDGTSITPIIIGNHFDGDNYPPHGGKGHDGIVDIRLTGSVSGGIVAANSLNGNTISDSADNDPDHGIDIGAGVRSLALFANHMRNYCAGGIKVAPGAVVTYFSNSYHAGLSCPGALERISGAAPPTSSAGTVTESSTNEGFEVTGATTPTTTVAFAKPGFTHKPSCSCNNESAATALQLTATASTLTVAGLAAGNAFMCTCVGH